VCERCGLGVLLETPSDAAPSPDEVFLIVDQDLVLRAVSRRAEIELDVREPDVVGQRLSVLLPFSSHARRLELAVQRAARGDDTLRHAAVRLDPSSEGRTPTRIACCGPPAAALLVFERAGANDGDLVRTPRTKSP
jgi:hypothetical protein